MHSIANLRDIKIDSENDEPMAYLIEWIVDRVYETINKCKLKSLSNLNIIHNKDE